MRHILRLVALLACLGSANAATPLPDSSPAFFAGEWEGTGEHGSYCYLQLGDDGWGWVLVDGGAGDWLGARMQWSNKKQVLQVEKIVALPAASPLRVMPLAKFALATRFNQSLSLSWSETSGSCQLQKIETKARHLMRARAVVEQLVPADKQR